METVSGQPHGRKYANHILLCRRLPESFADEHSDIVAFFDAVGTIPWTRSIRESKENCFPDINMPRILRLMA